VLGLRVQVDCGDSTLATALLAGLGAMSAAVATPQPDLRYRIDREGRGSSYALLRDGGEPQACADLHDLVFALDKALTVELQHRRRDLLFLHAAVIEWRGWAILLAAASGSGKSTTAWALLHHGFRYLSDELAPIDLGTMTVLPFPHALCLKQEPPPPYALPSDVFRHGARIDVPARALPAATITGARPLAAAFLVSYQPDLDTPRLAPVGRAEASARLYATALNPLAHLRQGLDAAVRIAEQVPCFALATAALPATCELIADTVARIVDGRAKAA